MIERYDRPTPNGHIITMFLAEAGLDDAVHPGNDGAGIQFKPECSFSPDNRMPAIVDHAPADGGEPSQHDREVRVIRHSPA